MFPLNFLTREIIFFNSRTGFREQETNNVVRDVSSIEILCAVFN